MLPRTSSYAHSTSSTPLLNATLGQALDAAAASWPDREAVVVRDQGVRLTFAALRTEVDRLAAEAARLLRDRRRRLRRHRLCRA